MGKKAKVGKSRKDKYYQLAKDTGFRSRAAFKLLQLNRKYEFLQSSRVCVDLCAAPGGWLQVAAQQMPVSSVIIGVDLAPIKPIHNVTTYQEDITSEKCRQILSKQLQTWKADIVLHDGAPNVGTNWLHDAFQQAVLTLKALKLATEFLRRGGWFVTKVFRSKDYNSLLWVFHQLFRKVFATKPQASRNESAEIFVVCQHYLAPDKIDPKLLDSKYVFSEVQMEPDSSGINLIHPEKAKRKAEGYPSGNYTLENKLLASKYIAADNHWQLLANCTEIVLDNDTIARHPLSTDEIREYCCDVKVLGKPALKSLANWRSKMKEVLDSQKHMEDSNVPAASASDVKNDDDDDDNSDSEIIRRLQAEKEMELKKKRKKVMREKRKLRDKMSLKMVIPGDQIEVSNDNEMFSLRSLRSCKDLDAVEMADMPDDQVEEDDTSPLGKGHRNMMQYSRHDDIDDDDDDDDDDDGNGSDSAADEESENDDDVSMESENTSERNPLLLDLNTPSNKSATNTWFSKEVFADVKDDEDDEFEVVPVKPSKIPDDFSDDSDNDENETADESETESERGNDKKNSSSVGATASGKPPVKLTPLELAVGEELTKSRKRRRELIDMSYHRYTYGEEEGLPDWFVEDERKHCRIERPVTKEQIEAYKAKKKAIDAAPIKKVAEAKARKKRKMLKRLEKARKKAETVTDSVDISDKAKMKQIKEIYKKAGLLKSEKKDVTYVVGKKGVGKRVSRPPGVKGRFRVVDPRMKKDNLRKKTETKLKNKKRRAKKSR